MTATTRKKIIENVKPFKRGAVSFYISNETNAIVTRMAEEMEITKSEMLDTIVTFANAHYVNVEAWHGKVDRRRCHLHKNSFSSRN